MDATKMRVGTEFEESHRFVVTRTIARGGMGVVYEAVLLGPEGFQKTVALKTIRDELAQRRDFVDLFVGEAKLVADLVHQNITQIYKLGRFASTFYIAMEYVHGVNLQRFIARHAELGVRVPVELGAFIVSRVCRGLAYAHDKRARDGTKLEIVHRDISPNNLMITSEGEVKITDFGIAKAAGLIEDPAAPMRMGKLAYMSPEQARCEAIDRRSDLYSLGLVAFELLTGETVFRSVSDGDRSRRRFVPRDLPAPRSVNPEIPETLDDILRSSLQPDVEPRYQDAGRMAYDLEYFLYHKGYGPTIVSLERHMRLLFPHLYASAARKEQRPVAPVVLTASEETARSR
ncbi:MAG: serine/threonine-protein kinase [Thermodesulfobacteriota bacterium]